MPNEDRFSAVESRICTALLEGTHNGIVVWETERGVLRAAVSWGDGQAAVTVMIRRDPRGALLGASVEIFPPDGPKIGFAGTEPEIVGLALAAAGQIEQRAEDARLLAMEEAAARIEEGIRGGSVGGEEVLGDL